MEHAQEFPGALGGQLAGIGAGAARQDVRFKLDQGSEGVGLVLRRSARCVGIIARHFLAGRFEQRPHDAIFKDDSLRLAAVLVVCAGKSRKEEVSFERFLRQVAEFDMKLSQRNRFVVHQDRTIRDAVGKGAVPAHRHDRLFPEFIVPASQRDLMPVVTVLLDAGAQIAHGEPCKAQKQGQRAETKTVKGDLLAAEHAFGIAGSGHQALLAKNLLEEKVAQKIGAFPLPDLALGQVFDRDANGLGQFGIEGGAFAHRGGKINPPKE